MGTTCSTYTYKCTKFLDGLEERAEFVDVEVVRSVVLKHRCTAERGCAGSGIGAIV
jgi:hypothetical protein